MRSLLIVLSQAERQGWAAEVAALAQQQKPTVLVGSPLQAARYLAENGVSPSHILLDIGTRGQDILEEIDQLAQQCEAGTRVLVTGDTNDIILYRGLISRGVLDYLPMPAIASEVVRILGAPAATKPAVAATPAPVSPVIASMKPAGPKRVISFMSAASGDGGSMAALNTAYALSEQFGGSTILVDMDYQFGMVAKSLNLQNQYGIADVFDHPDRGIDATLIKRMVVSYGKMHVITAPIDLRYLPSVSAEVIRELVTILHQSYDTVILDLPHIWAPWVATVMQQSTHLVLVAQLWLKSVSSAARMMRVFRDMEIPSDRIFTVVNRSGAKFTEAITKADFERVCGAPVRLMLANDIKAIVNAEAAARTLLEIEPSALAADIQKLARTLSGQASPADAPPPTSRGGLFSRLKG